MSRRKRKSMVPVEALDTPTDEQLAQGGYKRDFVTHVESNTKAMAFVSSHDPVERWRRDGRLSDSQLTAIAFLRRLWAITGLSQRVTASYGERIPGGGCNEHRVVSEIEARQDLHRIQGYVPKVYYDVFENCCRHGMPAGVAGEALGYGSRSGDIRAHQIVCFVADVVSMMERL